MNKKICVLSMTSLLMMVACSPSEDRRTEKTPAVAPVTAEVCRSPGLQSTLHENLQQAILTETHRLADPSLIDIDKIIEASGQLKLTLNSIQEKNQQCRGKLSILIPQNISQVAYKNAPLLEMKNYDTVIEDSMGKMNFQFNGSTLSFPLGYAFGANGAINYEDDSLMTSAKALAAALLPYGVRDTLNVGGQAISRETALQIVKGGGLLASETSTASVSTPDVRVENSTNTTQIAPPESIESPEQKALREAQAAERAAKIAAQRAAEKAAKAKAAREAAEALKSKPTTDNGMVTKSTTQPSTELTDFVSKSKPRVSEKELEDIRREHNKADEEIKSSWRNISPEIRKDLVEEQKSWEKQRNQRCRQMADKGADDSEASKLYMQCDTRMTKERVKNLQGYSIPAQ